MSDPKFFLSIVIPVYGNADSIEKLCEEVNLALSSMPRPYCLIFVVDGGPQSDWEAVEKAVKCKPNVHGLYLERNLGQSKATLLGLRTQDALFYAVMDADLQDPPEVLPSLLLEAQRTEGSAFGERIGAYQSSWRMVSSRLFKSLLHAYAGIPFRVGAYYVIPRDVRDRMLSLNLRAVQIVVMAWLCSKRHSTVPFRRRKRETSKSSYSNWRRIAYAWRSLRCAWFMRRQRNQSSFSEGQ